MKKKLEDLRRGDVIEGNIPKNRNHTVIILENYNKKKHIKCIPACSFSSHPSEKRDTRYLLIAGIEIPDFFFEEKKE